MITLLCCTNSRSLKFLSEGLPTSLSETLIFLLNHIQNITIATVEVTEALASVYFCYYKTNALNFDATVNCL